MSRRISPIPISDSDIEPMKANPCFKTPSFLARSKSVARKAQKNVDVDSDVVQLMDVQQYRKALGLNEDSSEDEKTECFEVDSNATEPVEEVLDDERILEVVGPAVEGFFRPDMDAINDDYDYDEPSKKAVKRQRVAAKAKKRKGKKQLTMDDIDLLTVDEEDLVVTVGNDRKPIGPVVVQESLGVTSKRILVDFGIGSNEFWGRVGNHKNLQYVSDCCEAPLYPPYYEDYLDIPEYYWED